MPGDKCFCADQILDGFGQHYTTAGSFSFIIAWNGE
jgi:hypothetical protein